ncbi:hypothetical protein M406DRAFT_277399 [Cryphonectria parasitica EP155]|uniref:Cytochrome P450 monooxygenase n=1 Tax=Cryphonectria parasitica (strain ATCC 38755 / EP155) TaxID=660469 RepID=A0A9P4Y4Q7_CRYP1|nr:uncharacterized protein M406DRAFT_277399 [Cryphonectria parasitica EP155]KAF3766493.1 hypothetical protein M406DRAFT_277399 [Cryphonectria parasitica EP155]
MRPTTTSKQFYLLGEDVSTAQDIDVPSSIDENGLRQLVASHFAIVDSQGIGFVSENEALTSTADVLDADGPVSITIDGKAVHEVPGPKGLPYVGNYLEVFPDHLGNHARLFEKYGPLFKTNNMGTVNYFTNDPALATIVFTESDFFSKEIIQGHPLFPIKNQEAGVFTSDTKTEEWKMAHKFLPPFFGPKAVRHYAPTMNQTVEGAFKVFDELADRDEAWNVYPYMMKLGSQAVGKLILGMDFNHFAGVDAPPHEMVMLIAESLELMKKITSLPHWYSMLPFGDPKRLQSIRDRMEALFLKVFAEASTGTENLDLQEAALKAENMIDYLVRATDNAGNKMPPNKSWQPLVVATGAGFTTTSSLMSWLIYSLVNYPGMQERLLQELVDNGFTDDTVVTDELTSKLTFLDHFVKETQRRHNPSFQPARTAQCDVVLPGGYKVPKGSVVVPSLHQIHNSPKIWGNPAEFDPDRWDSERVKNRPRNSYMPFATGQRMCIGFNFALQEARIFLTKLVWRYHFSLATEGAIDYDPQFQLIRPTNLYVRAERRVKWPPRSDL